MSNFDSKLKLLLTGEMIVCSNRICRRILSIGSEYYYDLLEDKNYCSQCGVMLRYHRKKANERGESLPLNLESVT